VSAPERTALTVGFVPLTDCAPLVVALERGFFAAHGLEVRLSREASWAGLRDRLAYGELDAAQVLAPMPLSTGLGVQGVRRAAVVPMTLSLNGNGITVSTALFEELRAAAPGEPLDRPVDARPLRAVEEARRRAGRPRPVLAHVHPVSTHHYLLRYRLATAGLEPSRSRATRTIRPTAAGPAPRALRSVRRRGWRAGCCAPRSTDGGCPGTRRRTRSPRASGPRSASTGPTR
jgi:two-component system, oxyanion-binding sensor